MAASSRSRAKSKRPMRVTKLMVMSGFSATKSGISGISQRVPKVGKYGKVQHATMPIAHQSERCVAQLAECRTHRLGIDFACRRQPDIAAVALEQPAAELFLQKRYLPADGALGQVEFLGSGGEGAESGHRLEGGKGAGAR